MQIIQGLSERIGPDTAKSRSFLPMRNTHQKQARKKSESGIYHIMLRGINRQQIFEDAEDCYKFLTILREYKGICEYSVYAYCLMGNHIHLLLKEGTESLEQVFKRVCGNLCIGTIPSISEWGICFRIVLRASR